MGEYIPEGRGYAQTSLEAFVKVDLRRNQAMVLNVIRDAGQEGCISEDIQTALASMPYGSVTNHFRTLINMELIEVIGRRKNTAGRSQRVYRATALGQIKPSQGELPV